MPILSINNNVVSFTNGQTILEVARENQIHIPTLCHLAGAQPTGQCRICVVETNGESELLPACATPAGENMTVLTHSPAVMEARKTILEMLIASGAHNCLLMDAPTSTWSENQVKIMAQPWHDSLCPAYGSCSLQDLAIEYGIKVRGEDLAWEGHPLDDDTPLIVRDFSRCIGCGRCIQACNEIQVNLAIPEPFGRRADCPQGWYPLVDYQACTHCGECVQACPTGALFDKKAFGRITGNEAEKIRTTCPYCGVGCQQLLHVKDQKVIKITGAENVSPNFGRLCVKGRFGHHFIHSPERLTTPLIKRDGTFQEASWEEALSLIAQKLSAIKNRFGSNSIGLLASARMTNEDNYIAQKFARGVLKTNNVDHCARLCHASTVAGLAAAFGSGAMTNPIGDVVNSNVILITGSNPTENHPVMSTFIKQAVLSGKTRLIVVDPRDITLGEFARMKLTQRLGTDVCWINGMMHVIIAENLQDVSFIDKRTEGFDALKQLVETYTPEYVETVTGIPRKDLIDAARLYANAPAAGIIYCMGITQHSTGTDNVKSLANLAMLCGNMGIPGGGVNPLRGQNNVQGACDMGALPNVFSGYQPVTDSSVVKTMEDHWGIQDLPGDVGYTLTQMLPMAHEGKIKSLYVIGENPMVSDPDLNHVEACLKNLDFLVVQDIFLTETATLADVVLPAASFAEKDGTFTNTERKVQRIRKAVESPGNAKPDWQILCELASKMGTPMAYDTAEAIFEEIAKTTPSYRGISYGRIEENGLHWPCPDTQHPGTSILHTQQFTRGKGLFHAVEYQPPAEEPDEQYPLFLTTGRILYHYHTGTMTMKSQGLNALAPECFAQISPKDAEELGILNGEKVRLVTRRGKITARARVSDRIGKGTVFVPFHFAKAAANRLTNAALDPVCRIPELKVCAVRLETIP